MEITVKSCKDCIFRVSHYNPDSMGHDTLDECIALKHLDDNLHTIAVYDSWEELDKFKELNERLENCPLEKDSFIIKIK